MIIPKIWLLKKIDLKHFENLVPNRHWIFIHQMYIQNNYITFIYMYVWSMVYTQSAQIKKLAPGHKTETCSLLISIGIKYRKKWNRDQKWASLRSKTPVSGSYFTMLIYFEVIYCMLIITVQVAALQWLYIKFCTI